MCPLHRREASPSTVARDIEAWQPRGHYRALGGARGNYLVIGNTPLLAPPSVPRENSEIYRLVILP